MRNFFDNKTIVLLLTLIIALVILYGDNLFGGVNVFGKGNAPVNAIAKTIKEDNIKAKVAFLEQIGTFTINRTENDKLIKGKYEEDSSETYFEMVMPDYYYAVEKNEDSYTISDSRRSEKLESAFKDGIESLYSTSKVEFADAKKTYDEYTELVLKELKKAKWKKEDKIYSLTLSGDELNKILDTASSKLFEKDIPTSIQKSINSMVSSVKGTGKITIAITVKSGKIGTLKTSFAGDDDNAISDLLNAEINFYYGKDVAKVSNFDIDESKVKYEEQESAYYSLVYLNGKAIDFGYYYPLTSNNIEMVDGKTILSRLGSELVVKGDDVSYVANGVTVNVDSEKIYKRYGQVYLPIDDVLASLGIVPEIKDIGKGHKAYYITK